MSILLWFSPKVTFRFIFCYPIKYKMEPTMHDQSGLSEPLQLRLAFSATSSTFVDIHIHALHPRSQLHLQGELTCELILSRCSPWFRRFCQERQITSLVLSWHIRERIWALSVLVQSWMAGRWLSLTISEVELIKCACVVSGNNGGAKGKLKARPSLYSQHCKWHIAHMKR